MAGAAGRGQDINEVYIIPHFVHDFKIDITYGAFLFHVYPGRQLNRTICMGLDLGSLQSQTGDSSVTVDVGLCTLWLAWQETVSAGLFANLVVYGAAVTSRQTLTQALLSDLVGEDLFDAAFSLYYFIGFVSIPFWTVITGGVMTCTASDRLQGHLDFLFARHGSSGISPCAGESTQRELTGHV